MKPLKILVVFAFSALLLPACGTKYPFPLAEPGEYQFGTRRDYKFIDVSREAREISLYVWYPARLPADTEPSKYNFDAEPDLGDAPYPVILSSAKVGTIFGPHLATHGFVVVGVEGQDSKDHWGPWLIDYPRDQVFALEQIASNSLKGLDGMIDFEQAGALGYSFDGYNALALSGARIDPGFYQGQCSTATPDDPAPEAWWIDYVCNLEGGWEEFVAQAGPNISSSTDGLWQPLTDDRIRAVMPMAPEGAWLFGARGLAVVDRPTLLIGATEDDINYYELEAVNIYENIGTPEKYLISFIDQDHLMIYNDEQVSVMKHFATAFFGYYLQERSEYDEFFSEKLVSKRDGLAWGVFHGNNSNFTE